MLVVTRHDVPEGDGEAFLSAAREALDALAARPGHLRGWVARSTDEPGLWVLASEWASVGAYRRALSAYDVKVRAVPVMQWTRDEPSAFEVLAGSGDVTAESATGLARDAGRAGPGGAAAPVVPPDLASGPDRGRGDRGARPGR